MMFLEAASGVKIGLSVTGSRRSPETSRPPGRPVNPGTVSRSSAVHALQAQSTSVAKFLQPNTITRFVPSLGSVSDYYAERYSPKYLRCGVLSMVFHGNGLAPLDHRIC